MATTLLALGGILLVLFFMFFLMVLIDALITGTKCQDCPHRHSCYSFNDMTRPHIPFCALKDLYNNKDKENEQK